MARPQRLARVRTPPAQVRPVAAGGWRRAILGLGVGAVAGALVSWVLPGER